MSGSKQASWLHSSLTSEQFGFPRDVAQTLRPPLDLLWQVHAVYCGLREFSRADGAGMFFVISTLLSRGKHSLGCLVSGDWNRFEKDKALCAAVVGQILNTMCILNTQCWPCVHTG